jgi:hypothetical protein
MANVRRLGFIPTRVSGGTPITFRKGRVLSGQTDGIFHGDGVKYAAGGDLVACHSGTDEQLLLASVAQGATFIDASNKRIESKFLPANTTYSGSSVEPELGSYVYIVDNPTMVEFEANVANSAIALTDLNLNYPIVLTAGSTTTGLSKHELNATGRATTSTFPFRVREFVRRADNDLSLVDVKVLCMINAGQAEPVTSAYTGT